MQREFAEDTTVTEIFLFEITQLASSVSNETVANLLFLAYLRTEYLYSQQLVAKQITGTF